MYSINNVNNSLTHSMQWIIMDAYSAFNRTLHNQKEKEL